MAKRSVDGSPRLAIAHEGTFYSDDGIAEIVAAVGKKLPAKRRKELADRLERAADTLAMDRAQQRAPTDKMSRERFEKIDKAAGALLKALGAGPAGGIGAMPTPILDGLMKAAISAAGTAGGVGAISDPALPGLIVAATERASRLGKSNSALVRNALDGVVLLQRLARQQKEAATAAQERSGNFVPRHVGDQARERWISELAKIYRDLWKCKLGVSQDSMKGEYTGPFFRFVVASGHAVGVKKGNLGLGKKIQLTLRDMDK